MDVDSVRFVTTTLNRSQRTMLAFRTASGRYASWRTRTEYEAARAAVPAGTPSVRLCAEVDEVAAGNERPDAWMEGVPYLETPGQPRELPNSDEPFDDMRERLLGCMERQYLTGDCDYLVHVGSALVPGSAPLVAWAGNPDVAGITTLVHAGLELPDGRVLDAKGVYPDADRFAIRHQDEYRHIQELSAAELRIVQDDGRGPVPVSLNGLIDARDERGSRSTPQRSVARPRQEAAESAEGVIRAGEPGGCSPDEAVWTVESRRITEFAPSGADDPSGADESVLRWNWIAWLHDEREVASNDLGDPTRHDDLLIRPITVEPVAVLENGQLHIWDGYHRVAAQVVKGMKTIPVLTGRPTP